MSGISYVCRYRLMKMVKDYFRKQKLKELEERITKRIYYGEDDYSQWHKRNGLYKYLSTKTKKQKYNC
tara:strand:+ start:786 stop:989 length:204 start_codon:yes stop_codon:yes gene_type:complete